MKLKSIITPTLFLLSLIAPASAKPNLIFILADDLGYADTTLYGHTSFYKTPNIQRLADRGLLFTNAYTAHPLCSPTRSSIMTGQDPARTGFTSAAGHTPVVILDKQPLTPRAQPDRPALTPKSISRLDTKHTTFPEVIQAAGYKTAHFGKWHLGTEPYSPLQHGFDHDSPHYNGPGPAGSYVAPWRFPKQLDFDPQTPNEHIEDRMADEAVAFIQANKDKPFFLNYWAFSVHAPFDAKQALIDQYAKTVDPKNPQRTPVYAAMVHSLDDAVGKIIDTVDRLGIADNTIIVFFSDNGGNMYSVVDGRPPTSNAPLRGGKATIYEGGTRVPCAVIWPGVTQPKTTTDALLSSTDWYPTLLDMLNLPTPPNQALDAISQTPAIRGQSAPRKSLICFVPSYYPKPGHIPATYHREGDWKLIRYHCDGPNGADRLELYNLAEDISETTNLADQHPDRVRSMNGAITRYLKKTSATVPRPNPAYKP
jgi:arylsulfatase A-like enzyme